MAVSCKNLDPSLTGTV